MSLTDRCATWSTLPLNVLDRINILKIIFLPKFLCVFRNCPTLLQKTFFREVDSCVGTFVWTVPPRIWRSLPFNYQSATGGWHSQTTKSIFGQQCLLQSDVGWWDPGLLRRFV